MKTDRELLELAANGAGYVVFGDDHPDDGLNVIVDGRVVVWRPLLDDGDAFRLAIKRNLWPYASSTNQIGVWSICEDGRMKGWVGMDCWHGDFGQRLGDFDRSEKTKEAAVRRAIVIAAAFKVVA